MRSLGWHVVPVTVPEAPRVVPAYLAIIARECFDQHRDVATGNSERLGPNTRERLREGARVSDVSYRLALADRASIRDEYAILMETADILAMPTTTQVAPPLNAVGMSGPSPFCVPFNLTGYPSLSMPIGRDPSGMSVGLLLSGSSGQDDRLIAAASQLEEALA